ncbi:MAG TPA: TerC family protein [Gemmatimonadaceae bacterium]|nr:TerC family protein [Gemmatimonadaceae bacterium]
MSETALWIAFNAGVLAVLALDLGVFNKKAHKISVKEAAIWSGVWITLSLGFAGVIYRIRGKQAALEFVTGYLIEYSLSIDNIFVIVLIFSYFRIAEKYQHRVLFWGIIGALVMRGAMIAMGALLIQRFHWILYVFGAFLVFTGIRMAMQDETDIEPESNPVLRLVRRLLPVTPDFRGQDFFVREEVRTVSGSGGAQTRLMATPLFIVLVLVETTDLIFAVDSIPAIFAITQDPLLVYTSNVCAILGLRSLFFMLAGVIHRFHYLKLGLAVVLTFVGVKMLISSQYEIPIGASLLVIAGILGLSVIASIAFPRDAPPPRIG